MRLIRVPRLDRDPGKIVATPDDHPPRALRLAIGTISGGRDAVPRPEPARHMLAPAAARRGPFAHPRRCPCPQPRRQLVGQIILLLLRPGPGPPQPRGHRLDPVALP